MNLLDLLIQKGCRLKKAGSTKGGEWQGPCPWCGDASRKDSNRFHVWPEENRTDKNGRTVACPGTYWCRPGIGHCGRHGDAIQFLIDYDGLTFREACGRLGQHFDRIEEQRYPVRRGDGALWTPADRGDPASMWLDQARKFVNWAFEQIFEAPDALAYLEGRGIREATLQSFGLGWNPGKKGGGLFQKRESWGLLPEKNEKTGRPRPLWLPVGWVIPYLRGPEVVRLRVRQVDGAEFGPRYYMVPGSSAASMVIEPARPGHRDVYVVVESELDAILLAQEAGDLVGVIALGSVSTRPDRVAAARLNRAAHILMALDNDGAGAAESHKWWRAHYPDAERWPVPEGKDPGAAYQKGVDIRAWVRAGLPEGLRR